MRGQRCPSPRTEDYNIELTSYRVLEPDGWMAQALVWWDQGGETRHQPLRDRQGRRSDTEEQANALAFELARAWIDQRG